MDLGDKSPHEEICGALLGDNHTKVISKYIPLTNVSSNKMSHYIPDPNQWLNTLNRTTFMSKEAKLDLIGVFHTHPNSAPIASVTDINEAGYEGLYWIYSPSFKSSKFYYYDGEENEKKFDEVNIQVEKENDNEK